MVQLMIRHESESSPATCAKCGGPMAYGAGPRLIADVSAAPVCRDCGRREAPSLVALLELARTAQRVVRIHRSTLVPPIDALLDLARAAEDYTLSLHDLRRRAA